LVQHLDATTRPAAIIAPPFTHTIHRGFEYRGDVVTRWTYIDIYLEIVRRLWKDHPDQRDAMAAAMASRGTVRCYIAKERAALFPGRPADWVKRHSAALIDGWYVDTNLSTERMRVVLPAAVGATGMKWGTDVRVYWRKTIVTMLSQ
jgi:hypothetical protein